MSLSCILVSMASLISVLVCALSSLALLMYTLKFYYHTRRFCQVHAQIYHSIFKYYGISAMYSTFHQLIGSVHAIKKLFIMHDLYFCHTSLIFFIKFIYHTGFCQLHTSISSLICTLHFKHNQLIIQAQSIQLEGNVYGLYILLAYLANLKLS